MKGRGLVHWNGLAVAHGWVALEQLGTSERDEIEHWVDDHRVVPRSALPLRRSS